MSHHRSFDSFNQPNLDSLSMQLSEKDLHFFSRHQRRKTRKERERLWRTNRIVHPGNRRGSDTSLQSSLVMAAAGLSRRGCISAKVTKSTSTGDLGVVIPPAPGSVMFPPIMMPAPVNNRPQFRREETIINPPFTHGMTDNSHHLGSRVPSVASALPRVTSGPSYTPSQCSVMPNSFVGMVRPSVYSGSFNVLNAVPYGGYFNNGMYPPVNGFYPGYAYPEYMYTNNPYLQYASYAAACNTQYQQDILPMNPIADSASETDFFPIKLSDSEYTDTGMRSHDESQLMFTQLLMQEHLAAQEAAAQEAAEARAAASIAAQSSSQQKSQEDCEAGAKTKTPFLKKIWPFNKTNPAPPETVRPPSGRKSAHSEAPPPSPAESSKSLNEDELDDDVFVDPEETTENKRNVSVASLPHVSETANIDSVFCKIKTKLIKFRRATSYMNNLEKIDTIELTSRVRHSSLLQLSKTDSSVKNIEIHKEKWLHASEGISLMNGDASTEHVSR